MQTSELAWHDACMWMCLCVSVYYVSVNVYVHRHVYVYVSVSVSVSVVVCVCRPVLDPVYHRIGRKDRPSWGRRPLQELMTCINMKHVMRVATDKHNMRYMNV